MNGIKGLAPDARPLFLLGVPRSGTTFLHHIVNAHSRVCLTDELRVCTWLVQESKKLREGYDIHGNPYPINEGETFSTFLLQYSNYLLFSFYNKLALQRGKTNVRYYGDKFPHYHAVLPYLVKYFPRARFIMIHRDIRDTISSNRKGHDWSLEKSTDYVCRIYKAYILYLSSEIERGNLNSDDVMHIEYEILCEDVFINYQRILEFLNLKDENGLQEQLAFFSRTDSHSVRKSKGNAKPFDYRGNYFAQRKHTLSSEENELIERKLHEISDQLDMGREMVARAKYSNSRDRDKI